MTMAFRSRGGLFAALTLALALVLALINPSAAQAEVNPQLPIGTAGTYALHGPDGCVDGKTTVSVDGEVFTNDTTLVTVTAAGEEIFSGYFEPNEDTAFATGALNVSLPLGDVTFVVTITGEPYPNGVSATEVRANSCQSPPVDLCVNIDGVQETVPAGNVRDDAGNCTIPPPPPVDLCVNIDGVQETVPAGNVQDDAGNCTIPPPAVTLKVGTNKGMSKLKIDVDPNLKNKRYWKFTVYKLKADGVSYKKVDTYRTQGPRETRTLNYKRGTYKVVVYGKYNFLGATSDLVYLKK